MKNIVSLFTDSAKEFKSVFAICATGMLVALSYILETFSFTIVDAKVNFAFIAIAAIGMLFGPTVSFFAGGLCDIVGFIAKPDGGFLPIYVLIAMLQGLIYGLLLYKKSGKKLVVSIVVARLIDVLVINMVINTYANIYYGFVASQSLPTIIKMRAVKNFIELGIDLPLMLAVLPAVCYAYHKSGVSRKTV